VLELTPLDPGLLCAEEPHADTVIITDSTPTPTKPVLRRINTISPFVRFWK
jgi:hypothetical protein